MINFFEKLTRPSPAAQWLGSADLTETLARFRAEDVRNARASMDEATAEVEAATTAYRAARARLRHAHIERAQCQEACERLRLAAGR